MKPHRMNWPAVIDALRAEATKDVSRSQDAITLRGDKVGAMQLAHVALVGFRLAAAFEIGMKGEDAIAKDQSWASKKNVDTDAARSGRGRPSGIPEKKPRQTKAKIEFEADELGTEEYGVATKVTDPAYRDCRVDSVPVEPHRYLWDAEDAWRGAIALKDWKAGIPYKEGEVVWLDVEGVAKRGLIYRVLWDRNRGGDRREKYKVQFETKRGTFSNSWQYAYAGHIQRGYKLAGLAPDIPDGE